MMMTTYYELKEAIENFNKPDQPDLIVESKKNKFVAYFRSNKKKIGVGKTEVEALNNLKRLI